jgi:hypothetical protein
MDSNGSATPTTFVYGFFRIDRNVTFSGATTKSN